MVFDHTLLNPPPHRFFLTLTNLLKVSIFKSPQKSTYFFSQKMSHPFADVQNDRYLGT